VNLTPAPLIYFISDFHLGAPDHASSLEREKTIVKFLDEIKLQATELFLVGDMFDFWYEYRQVVPKGYVRLLGKLAELSDAGIKMHFFVGNHDMWMKDYFQKELNIPVYYEPRGFERAGKKFLVGHGDGLGPGDHGYKRLKKIFRNPACKWLFGILPPVIGMGIANYMSRRSRAQTGSSEETFFGEDREWLITYCKESLKENFYDFFVFGHRHLPIDFRLKVSPGPESRYINLGDWISFYTYAVFDGNKLELKSYCGKDQKIVRN
jgi:UDP-2,3-diacylglucosamine hydrolase